MIKIFLDGGPIMWPLLVCSIVAFATALERFFFIARERTRRRPKVVDEMLRRVEHHDLEGAVKAGQDCGDYGARLLASALLHRAESCSSPRLRAANPELK